MNAAKAVLGSLAVVVVAVVVCCHAFNILTASRIIPTAATEAEAEPSTVTDVNELLRRRCGIWESPPKVGVIEFSRPLVPSEIGPLVAPSSTWPVTKKKNRTKYKFTNEKI